MAIKGPKPEEMTVKWFINLEDHPRQRDTERHAQQATKKHLAEIFATQNVVAVVRYKGVWYKLDGHTRALLWKQKKLTPPHRVIALRYECDTRKEFNKLYLSHNNKNAAESIRDLAYGRLRELGLPSVEKTLASQAANVARVLFMLQTGAHKIENEMHIESMLMWLPQFKHFNDQAVSKKRRKTHSAFTVAEFITHRRDGAVKSDEFWEAFHAGAGNRIDGESDAVDALQRVHDKRKAHGVSAKGAAGGTNTDTLVGLALRYYDGFSKDTWYRKPSTVLRNHKAAHNLVQKEFGRIVLPGTSKTPPSAIKGVEIIVDIPWYDDDYDDDDRVSV